MADNTVTVAFEADTSGLNSGADNASDYFKQIESSAEETTDSIENFFSLVEKSTGQILQGVLQGTQTWQQAMQKVFSGILASFINDLVVKMQLNWISSELSMTAATQEGNALRLSSDEAASAGSMSARAGDAISSILNDAKEVFGGIFAFLAPELGPAAAGPAASGSATVAALASGITYAESGAWNIPNNTLAYLHAGEMVVPQSFASSLREGSGLSGGDNYTININAVDTQTGAQFLKNNASVIASTLSSQVRNFNKNVPVWKS